MQLRNIKVLVKSKSFCDFGVGGRSKQRPKTSKTASVFNFSGYNTKIIEVKALQNQSNNQPLYFLIFLSNLDRECVILSARK